MNLKVYTLKRNQGVRSAAAAALLGFTLSSASVNTHASAIIGASKSQTANQTSPVFTIDLLAGERSLATTQLEYLSGNALVEKYEKYEKFTLASLVTRSSEDGLTPEILELAGITIEDPVENRLFVKALSDDALLSDPAEIAQTFGPNPSTESELPPSQVPLPATLPLMAGALSALLIFGRRRRLSARSSL